MRNMTIISGSSHPLLANEICNRLGIPLGECKITKFANKETNVHVQESVRDVDVYIVQSGCGNVSLSSTAFVLLCLCVLYQSIMDLVV